MRRMYLAWLVVMAAVSLHADNVSMEDVRLAEDEAYVVLTPNDEGGYTLTFVYDNMRAERTETTYGLNVGSETPKWLTDDNAGSITHVVFDESFAEARPTSTAYWFSGLEALVSVEEIENLNTQDVTDMSYMFNGCSSLETLDLSGFNVNYGHSLDDYIAFFSPDRKVPRLLEVDNSYYNGIGGNYITLHTNTTGGYALIGWELSNDYFIHEDQEIYEKVIPYIECVVIDGVTYDYAGICYTDYGIDTSVEHNITIYFNEPLTTIWALFGNTYNIDFLDMSHLDASRLENMQICIFGMVALETVVLPANLNTELCASTYITSIDNTALQHVYCFSGTNTTGMLNGCTSLTSLSLSADMSGLAEDACEGVGSEDNPCLLEVPEGFDFGDVDTTDDYFYWKGGCFCIEPFLLGDANHDGSVTITDVTYTVNKVLQIEDENFHFKNADVNQDHKITITDVSLIVDIILSQ